MKKLVERGRVFLPWISLATGIGTGVIMDRRPERAPLIAIAAGVGWFVLSGGLLAGKLITNRLEKRRELAERLVAFSHFAGMQSITQLCIFFSFPFYVRAASLRLDHAVFLGLVALAGAVSLWDPLYEWVLARPWARAFTQAFATFSGLNCVLPILGLSNRASLYVSAAATVVGSPLIASVGRRIKEGVSRPLLLQLAAASAIPFLLVAGAASAIPPAPLRLTESAIGTQIRDKSVLDPSTSFERVPAQLVCFTSIRAPRGLRDQLLHVWRHGRSVRDRVVLDVVGGREAGYRTWSIKQNLGAEPDGKWSCTVETASGQVLGRASVRIGPTDP